MQIRKNKLQSFSVQLSSSSSSQASRSSSIETHQNDVLSDIRTLYESNVRIRQDRYESDARIRQNRYADVRNSQFYSDARYDNRNRQFNTESRFNSESRFDSNRTRIRQYEISRYAPENSEIRRALSKRHIYALESYEDERFHNYAKENLIEQNLQR
jgi:hypothetical protein